MREFGLAVLTPPAVVLAPRGDDEDVVLLACQRSTFEWALRASVASRPGLELREGVLADLWAATRIGAVAVAAGLALAGQVAFGASRADLAGLSVLLLAGVPLAARARQNAT